MHHSRQSKQLYSATLGEVLRPLEAHKGQMHALRIAEWCAAIKVPLLYLGYWILWSELQT